MTERVQVGPHLCPQCHRACGCSLSGEECGHGCVDEAGRLRFAYADPPYIGQAKKHYGPDAREVNHALLIAHLCEFDAWALSLSSPSLKQILPLCPDGVRVAVWVKPFASFKPGVNPAYAWEPVIYYGARKRERTEPTVRDWVSANITLKRGLSGAKPHDFCVWLFDLIGLRPEDEFVDVFPGSGAVTRAWEAWRDTKRHDNSALPLFGAA